MPPGTSPAAVHRSAASRPYRSVLRAEQARATRRRVREAAEHLFLERGYVATSMDDVAAGAGVSRQTVFSAFGTKSKLLKEVVDVRLAGDDEPVAVLDRPAGRRMLAASDPAEAIRLHAALVVGTMARTVGLWRVIVAAADSDPEIEALRFFYDEGRLEGVGAIVDVLARLGALRRHRSRRRAKEAVWLLTGSPTVAVALERGWSQREIERWLADGLRGLLLDERRSP